MTSIVFQWFSGLLTIGFNGSQWSGTIGQTMEWFRWIVQVHHEPTLATGAAKTLSLEQLLWRRDE